jgi:hypothetical protein
MLIRISSVASIPSICNGRERITLLSVSKGAYLKKGIVLKAVEKVVKQVHGGFSETSY